jgi:hypothetical protein
MSLWLVMQSQARLPCSHDPRHTGDVRFDEKTTIDNNPPIATKTYMAINKLIIFKRLSQMFRRASACLFGL